MATAMLGAPAARLGWFQLGAGSEGALLPGTPLATQIISRAGLAPTYVAASENGDRFEAGHSTFLHVRNGAAAPITITVIVHAADPWGNEVIDNASEVSNGQASMIGPFPPEAYRAIDGFGTVTYTDADGVTIGAFEIR